MGEPKPNVVEAGREAVHAGSQPGRYAAIRRDIALYALRAGVGNDWHESGLTARLGGSHHVDNAAPLWFKGEEAEAFLELDDGDGNLLRINLADLLATVTGEYLNLVQIAKRSE